MTLADRLAARLPRRVVVALQVTDPGDDTRKAVEEAEQAVALIPLMGDGAISEVTAEALRDRAHAAREALDTHYEQVWLRSVPPAEWEALSAAHISESGDVDDEGLPLMLAACAEDESLRDSGWWAERVAEWPYGDVLALRLAVIRVNEAMPSVGLGKG